MLLKHFSKLCLVVSLCTNLGCSTGARIGGTSSVVENCIPDPRNNSFQCTDKDGVHQTKAWELGMEGYWCFPAKPMAEYLKGCK